MRILKTALFVGAASSRRESIASLLEREWGLRVRRASTFEEGVAGVALLPDLVLLEPPLEGGAALDLARRAGRLSPAPVQVVLGGRAGEQEAFALGQAGVHAYLTHPLSAEELSVALRAASSYQPDLAPIVRTVVGQRGLTEVQQEVRHLMVTEAFARAGSRVGAGRLLKVTRQAVQQALRGSACRPPSDRGVPARPIVVKQASDSLGS